MCVCTHVYVYMCVVFDKALPCSLDKLGTLGPPITASQMLGF